MSREALLTAAQLHNQHLETSSMLRAYHDGNHLIPYASPRYQGAFSWALNASIENLCPAVIAAHTDRLAISDWGNPDLADHHGLDRLARMVHEEVYMLGNAYVIVWRNPTTSEPQPVLHPAESTHALVDPERPDQLAACVKFWLNPTTGMTHAAIYDQHVLTRWRVTGATVRTPGAVSGVGQVPDDTLAWEPHHSPDAPHEEPHDFGTVPAVWWKRKAPNQFARGISVLRDVISPQDRLNKANADILTASERVAAPIRYVLDVAPEMLQAKLNPQTGLLEPPKAPLDEAAHSLLTMTAKGPAGQFPAPDAASLLELKNDLEAEIARITGVPMYYLAQVSGDVPSGESLRVVTSRLTAAVEAFQRDATPPWRGLLQLLGEPDPRIEWADPQQIGEVERVDIAERKQRLGYALEDAIGILEEADHDGIIQRARQHAAENGAAVGRALAAGTVPTAY